MYPVNPDLIKAEIEYRQTYHIAVTKREQLALSLVTEQFIVSSSYLNPIRHKIGKLLINWGMQLVGSIK